MQARDALVSKFCDKILAPYSALFEEGSPPGRLEFVEQRFVWLRKALHSYSIEHQSIFPRRWCVGRQLAKAFCVVTRQHLTV